MADSLLLVCPGLGGFPFQDKANDLRAVVEAARDDSSEKAADLWLMNPYMSVAMENPTPRNTLRDLARDNGRCWLNNPLLIRPMKPPAASGFGKFASRRWSSAANATSQTFTKSWKSWRRKSPAPGRRLCPARAILCRWRNRRNSIGWRWISSREGTGNNPLHCQSIGGASARGFPQFFSIFSSCCVVG